MSLEVTHIAAGFVAAPVGRCLRGPTFAYAGVDAGLFVQLWWGRYSEHAMAALWQAVPGELGAAPHASLIDASRVEHVDPVSVEQLADRLRRYQEALRAAVTRQAIVRPDGVTGMMFAGFTAVVGLPYPVQVFATRGEALAWLDRADAAAVVAAIDDAARGDPLLADLRALLDADPRLDAPAAARRLGVSTRTLQRRLTDAGTSFRDERNAARLHAAQARLLATDDKLDAIAADVGCASAAHLATLFRRHVGEAPGAWRARRRGG